MPATSTAARQAGTTHLYEGMFLLDSGKFASDPDGQSAQLVALIEKAGGEVVAHRPWQDGRLAYELEGHRKGLHYVAMFKMDGSRMGELGRACKLSNQVIRHMVIKHEEMLFDAMVNALTSGPVEEEPPPPAAEAERPRRGERRRAEEPETENEE